MEIKFPIKTSVKNGFNDLFDKLIKREYSLNNKITIDFFNVDLSVEYNIQLARLVFEYNCELVGISEERLNIINSIINTGYFIKENMSELDYFLFFKGLLEDIDFNLIIIDNIYYNSINYLKHKKIDLLVAQPLYFDENYFYYKVLKTGYTQPKDLEKALINNKEIWEYRSINKYEIGKKDCGFRLASNLLERQYLDLYKDIISKRLSIFTGGSDFE